MKASDIVAQLAVRLPQFTDKFTNEVSITSLTRSGSTATADTAAAHGLTVGDQVNIKGAESPIDITTLTRAGTVGTLVTTTEHDITELTGQTVELDGSTEVEFNGSFVVLTVPNRKTITFIMVDSGPTTATGSPELLNGSNIFQGYNGLYAVASTPTTTQFTYTLTTTPPLTTARGTIIARTLPRISASISVERAVAAYSAQPAGEYWAFVILGDVTASKDRRIDSDAVANQQRGEEWRQQLIHPFTVAVFFPTSNEIAAADSRDEAEELLRPICRSLLGKKLDSNLYVGAQNPINFSDHGFTAYNTAFYVHTYVFQSVSDLTFDDTIGYDDDVALRNIDTTILIDVNGLGTKEDGIEANVDLDDTPL